MVSESIDHENDAICNAMRMLLVLPILQWKIKQIPLTMFHIIVKKQIYQILFMACILVRPYKK